MVATTDGILFTKWPDSQFWRCWFNQLLLPPSGPLMNFLNGLHPKSNPLAFAPMIAAAACFFT